ncbi:uncharacterized protein QC761_104495 [Podospora bellae-mahoneyi]|uniref:Uncharacterized protein n=1 Tax=Podospora bellae-mahoneyi TaxID=2093777 RepID=A0ABR0FVS5_9PEZI|nr:hypothetical protein QC761_104495 [Podospora bellae-mahoneyi]
MLKSLLSAAVLHWPVPSPWDRESRPREGLNQIQMSSIFIVRQSGNHSIQIIIIYLGNKKNRKSRLP